MYIYIYDFYHNWTNSILQQLERKLWKIADKLFRISLMTNSFQFDPCWVVSTQGRRSFTISGNLKSFEGPVLERRGSTTHLRWI